LGTQCTLNFCDDFLSALNFEALLHLNDSRQRHTVCDGNVVTESIFIKCITGRGIPQGASQMPNMLGPGFCGYFFVHSHFPHLHILPFSPQSLPLPLLSPISPYPSPPPRRCTRNLAIANRMRSA